MISPAVHASFPVGQDGDMATAPVILLPPSEGKAEGGSGKQLRIANLSFSQLEEHRTTLRAALGAAM